MVEIDKKLGKIVQEESARRNPQLAAKHFSLGKKALKAQRYKEARGHFQVALNWDAKDKYFIGLGEAYLGLESLDEAIKAFDEAIRLNPENAKTCSEACCNLGQIYLKSEKLDEAVEAFNEAIRFNPKNTNAHYDLGRVLHKKDDISNAIAQYKVSIRCGLDNADVHFWLGTALEDDNLKEAISELEKAIKLDKFNPVYREVLAIKLNKAGQYEEALREFEKSIELGRENGFIHTEVGLILEKKGKLQEAIKHYEKALEVEPGYDIAKKKLDSLPEYQFQIITKHIRNKIKEDTNQKDPFGYHIQGEVTNISDQLTTIMYRYPNFIDAYQILATIYITSGTLDEAKKYIKTYKRLTSKNDVPHLKINEFIEGGYYYALGLNDISIIRPSIKGYYKKATEHWTKAQELDPRNIYIPKNKDIELLRKRASRIHKSGFFCFPGELHHIALIGSLKLIEKLSKNTLQKPSAYLLYYLVKE